MTLRLAGEEYGTIQGLDSSGWLKEVVRNSLDYGLKVTQNGAGLSLDLPSATSAAKALRLGGDGILYRSDQDEVSIEKSLVVQRVADAAGKGLRMLAGVNEYFFVNKMGAGWHQVELGNIYQVSNPGNITLSPGAGYSVMVARALDMGNNDLNNANNLQVKGRLSNPGSGDNGWLTVGDSMKVVGDFDAHPDDVSGAATIIRTSLKAQGIRGRSTHLADADVPEDFGMLYLYNDGAGTRQLVIKYKASGTVYTGTVTLS